MSTWVPVGNIKGPPGAAGAASLTHEHEQVVAQSVWSNIVHNFGRYPVSWSLFDTDGRECSEYVVQHLDLNTSRVSMDIPTAGVIRLIA